jgi:hypothetical protein
MNREIKPESKPRLEKRKFDGLKSILKPSKSNEMMVPQLDMLKKQPVSSSLQE